MKMEANFNHNTETEDGEYDVEDSLGRAGLFNVQAPKKGTMAYKRLIEAAKNYMSEVRKVEEFSSPKTDSENFFSEIRKKSSSSSSDISRRQYHNQLALMLLGKQRTGMSKDIADQISNFAASLTGNENYLDRW